MRVGALRGMTVIECSTFVSGPYAAYLLGALGARVIKIESTAGGDPYRYFTADADMSPNFAHLNRSKESLALDLKKGAGQRICIELLRKADVFVENLRPGAPERLGLGYEALRSTNKGLVYCALSAFGETGPYCDKPGFDTLGQAMSGILSLLTDRDQPRIMGIALSDYATAVAATYGVLGALLNRVQSGEGCKVETSLLQASLSFFGEAVAGYLRQGVVPDRMSRVKNSHAFAFVTKDKLPLVIHCSVPERFWLNLLRAAERSDLASDHRFRDRNGRREHYAELEMELAGVFATRTRAEWLERLEQNDVPASALYNVAEVLADQQVQHSRLVEEVEHKTLGKMKFVGSPVTFSGLSQRQETAPPLLGEHTEMVLGELGYTREEIQALAEQGVVKLLKQEAVHDL